MEDVVQVKGLLERQIKRRLFSALALREKRYTQWLREQSEQWLQEVETVPQAPQAAQESAGVPAQ